MKFTIDSDSLNEALSITYKNSLYVILTHDSKSGLVHLKQYYDGCVSSYELELCEVEGDKTQDVEVLIPKKTIESLVSLSKVEEQSIVIDAGTVTTVSTGGAEVVLSKYEGFPISEALIDKTLTINKEIIDFLSDCRMGNNLSIFAMDGKIVIGDMTTRKLVSYASDKSSIMPDMAYDGAGSAVGYSFSCNLEQLLTAIKVTQTICTSLTVTLSLSDDKVIVKAPLNSIFIELRQYGNNIPDIGKQILSKLDLIGFVSSSKLSSTDMSKIVLFLMTLKSSSIIEETIYVNFEKQPGSSLMVQSSKPAGAITLGPADESSFSFCSPIELVLTILKTLSSKVDGINVMFDSSIQAIFFGSSDKYHMIPHASMGVKFNNGKKNEEVKLVGKE